MARRGIARSTVKAPFACREPDCPRRIAASSTASNRVMQQPASYHAPASTKAWATRSRPASLCATPPSARTAFQDRLRLLMPKVIPAATAVATVIGATAMAGGAGQFNWMREHVKLREQAVLESAIGIERAAAIRSRATARIVGGRMAKPWPILSRSRFSVGIFSRLPMKVSIAAGRSIAAANSARAPNRRSCR